MAISKVPPIPAGYSAITPYLCVDGAAAALDFYKRAFGAIETMRFEGPNGKIGHAEIRIGGAPVMLADEAPEMGFRSPTTQGNPCVNIMMYVEDVDTLFRQALAAGATELRPVRNEFYGDRTGSLRDPYGHIWHIATHIEDLTAEQLDARAAEAMSKAKDAAG